MRDVAIVGAGELGGLIAYVLARRDWLPTITLVDEYGSVAAGKALDIVQAAPIAPFSTRVAGSRELHAAAGASVIVIADHADGVEWCGVEGLALLARLAELSPQSLLLCAGAGQRDLVERGVRERGIARERLMGSAPEALASALKAVVALEVNGSPRDVALTVLGVPPARLVVPWEDATIAGLAATRLLDGSTRRRLATAAARLWPPGPGALAAAAGSAVAALLGRSHRLLATFVAPDDRSGRRTRAAALPARLGAAGLVGVELPRLDVHDQVALDNALQL
jgi:malate/lactate dehydrogenase